MSKTLQTKGRVREGIDRLVTGLSIATLTVFKLVFSRFINMLPTNESRSEESSCGGGKTLFLLGWNKATEWVIGKFSTGGTGSGRIAMKLSPAAMTLAMVVFMTTNATTSSAYEKIGVNPLILNAGAGISENLQPNGVGDVIAKVDLLKSPEVNAAVLVNGMDGNVIYENVTAMVFNTEDIEVNPLILHTGAGISKDLQPNGVDDVIAEVNMLTGPGINAAVLTNVMDGNVVSENVAAMVFENTGKKLPLNSPAILGATYVKAAFNDEAQVPEWNHQALLQAGAFTEQVYLPG